MAPTVPLSGHADSWVAWDGQLYFNLSLAYLSKYAGTFFHEKILLIGFLDVNQSWLNFGTPCVLGA